MPARPSSRPRAAVARLPRRGSLRAVAVAPSATSVLLGLAILMGSLAAYLGARESSVFAVRSLQIHGASPRVAREVRRALRAEQGTSLLRIDPEHVAAALAADVPEIESATIDRAFPHTLAIRVRPERPVAVLRQGAQSWLVSARRRVLRVVPHGSLPALPRIWLGRDADPRVGERVDEAAGAQAVAALAPVAAARFPFAISYVRTGDDDLTLVLRRGIELRLGGTGDLRLKLSIARRILERLPQTGPGAYLDVSVPERPVAFPESQLGG